MKNQTQPDKATLESYQLWCAKTRDMLRTAKGKGVFTAGRFIDSKETSALDTQIERVFALLKLLRQERTQTEIYDKCLVRFEKIKTETEEAGKPTQGKAPDDKASKDTRAAKLAADLGTLGTEIEAALQGDGGDKAAKKEFGELIRYQKKFDDDFEAAFQDTTALKASKFTPAGATDQIFLDLRIQDRVAKRSVDEFKLSMQKLSVIEKEIERLEKAVEFAEAKSIKNAKDKPTAEAALLSVSSYRNHAMQNYGSEALVTQYNQAIEDASVKIKAGEWTAAAGLLNPLVGKYNAKKVKKAGKTAKAELQKSESFTAAEEALIALKVLAPPEVYGQHRAALDTAVSAYLASNKPSDSVFAQLRVAIEAEKLKAEEASKELGVLGKDIDSLLLRCNAVSPPLTQESFQIDVDAFAGMMRERRVVAARELGARLKKSLTDEIASGSTLQAAWNKAKGGLDTLRTGLGEVRQKAVTADRMPAVGRAALALGKVGTADVQNNEAGREWQRLVDNYLEGGRELKRLQEEESAYAGLSGARQAAEAEVAALKKTVDAAVATWRQALDKRAGRAVDVGDAVETTASVIDRWSTAQLACVTPAELSAAKERALVDLRSIQEFVAGASDERALDRLGRADANQKAQSGFDSAWDEFQAAVDALRAIDTKTAMTLAAAGQKVRDAAPADYAKATKGLQALLEQVRAARTDADGLVAAARERLDTAAESVKGEIDRVKAAGKSRFLGRLPFMKVYAEAFDVLEAELKDLKLTRESQNVGAIDAATRQLGTLKTQAALYAPDASPTVATVATLVGAAGQVAGDATAAGGAGMAESVPQTLTMDAVIERYKEALARFKRIEDDLKADDPNTLKGLITKRDELTQRIYTVTPEAGHGLIDLFTTALQSGEASLEVARQVRRDYDAELVAARCTYKTIRKNKSAPEYAKEVKARLDAIETMVESPEKLTAAYSKLKALNEEAGAAALDPQKLLECETKSKTTKQEASEAEVAYEKLRALTDSTFVSNYVKPKVTYIGMAEYAVTSADGDKGLIQELNRMVGLAEKSAKQADFATALKQIEATKTRALQICKDPHGPAVGSRNALPQNNTTFRDALTAFKGTLDTVHAETMKGVKPAAAEAVSAKLGNQLADIKGYFDPAAFEAGIKALIAPKLPAEERRGKREVLLAQIRATRMRLAQSPKIVSLLSNPVAGQTFSNGYRRLSDALNALDSNVQRSC